MPKRNTHFRRRDQAEVVVGACIMGFPAAVTAEIWDLGEQLTLGHILLFAAASLAALASTIYVFHGHDHGLSTRREFIARVLGTYGLTFLVCALMLFGLGQFDIIDAPLTGLKRTVIVTFPASFAATALDNVGDANSGE